MKRINYINKIFTLLLVATTAFAQTTNPEDLFSTSGLSVNAYHYNFFDGTYSTSYTYFTKDSICEKEVTTFISNWGEHVIHFYFEGEKMYSLYENNCIPYLIYDFGVEAGSVISDGLYKDFLVGDKYEVTLLNGENRTRFDLSRGTFTTSWIEGIGDINYGLTPFFADFEGYDVFVCAKIDSALLWENEVESENCDAYSCVYPKADFELSVTDYTVSITNKTEFGKYYTWDWGDGNTSTGSDPIHTYEAPGCYFVKMTVTNDCFSEGYEVIKTAPICSVDSWEEDYRFDSLQYMQVYKYSENIEFVFQGMILYKSMDGGDSWTRLYIPEPPEGVSRFINGVHFYNENDGIINCGHYGAQSDQKAILVTHDGGVTWEEKVEGSYFINSLTIGLNGEAWASAGNYRNYLFRTLDFGDTWEKIEFEQGFQIYGFSQIDDSLIYGTAFRGVIPTGEYYIARSTDKGSTWSFDHYSHGIHGGKFFDADLGYSMKDGNFYITQNGGVSWTLKDLPVELKSIHFSSPTHGWITDVNDVVHYTSDALENLAITNCAVGRINRIRVFNDTIAYGTIGGNPMFNQTGGIKVSFYKNLITDCNNIDADNDGFISSEDCDDDNPDINPGQIEEPYNGLDDDCDESTLDDDLDQDGFLIADDCDDQNPEINPDAEEIPNNGIDEDCDGTDLLTTTNEISESDIKIYPNPAYNSLYLFTEGKTDLSIDLYDVNGKWVLTKQNTSQIDVSLLKRGVYIANIYDMNSGKRFIKRVMITN